MAGDDTQWAEIAVNHSVTFPLNTPIGIYKGSITEACPATAENLVLPLQPLNLREDCAIVTLSYDGDGLGLNVEYGPNLLPLSTNFPLPLLQAKLSPDGVHDTPNLKALLSSKLFHSFAAEQGVLVLGPIHEENGQLVCNVAVDESRPQVAVDEAERNVAADDKSDLSIEKRILALVNEFLPRFSASHQ